MKTIVSLKYPVFLPGHGLRKVLKVEARDGAYIVHAFAVKTKMIDIVEARPKIWIREENIVARQYEGNR